MVRGLDKFTHYFKGFQDTYILIGGAATDVWIEESGLRFRATKDLDVILVLEAVSQEFVRHFWKFIGEGKYEIQQKSNGKPKVYRFAKPKNMDFPSQIEIFSRKPDISGDFEKAHLAPIPLGEDLGSLSAILMNDKYYTFTQANSNTVEGLRLATTPALICLKARAFLDIKKRLEKEEWENNNEKSKLEKDLKKHRNDIIRIALILTADDAIQLESPMREDIRECIEATKANPPDYKQLAKNLGVSYIDPKKVFQQLHTCFRLDETSMSKIRQTAT